MNNFRIPERFRRKAAFILAGCVLIPLGIYMRLYPLLTHVSHTANEQASLLVINNIRRNLELSFEKDFPDVSPIQKEQWLRDKLNAALRRENDKVRTLIQATASGIDKLNPKRKNYPYLLASDSFYYYRLTQQILDKGAISADIKGSKYLNEMMLAPLGHWEPLNLHPYVGYGVYRFLSFWQKDIPLDYAVAFTPLVIMSLSILVFLWICSQLELAGISSFLAGLYFVLSPIFLKRSTWGWYDNDPYNTFFPLVILAILFYGLQNRAHIKRVLVAAILCSFAFALYALFWHGWMFLLGAVTAGGILIIPCSCFVLREKGQSRNLLVLFTLVPVGVLAGIGLVFGVNEFFVLIREGFKAINDFLKPQISLWPNLYIGVGELHKASLATVIDLTGNYVFFIMAALGLILPLITLVKRGFYRNLYPALMISIFFVLALFLTFNAERFALLCLVPLALLFALNLDFLLHGTIKLCRRRIPKQRQVICSAFLIFIFILLFILPVITSRQKLPQLINRIYNDIWQETLVGIREGTPATSIIHTWWSPGHFITAVAQRRVIFDGATINKPQAYWMARVFLSPDEREALGILRMLDTSANTPVDYLQSLGLSLSASIDVLDSILPATGRMARQRLSGIFTEEQKDRLLSLIHQRPPAGCLLIYNELIEKHLQLSFVGNWDFKKIAEVNNDPQARRAHFHSGVKPYVQFVWKMEGGQPRYSGILKPIRRSGDKIIFEQGVTVDSALRQCRIDSKTFGRGVPYSIFYAENGDVREKKSLNADLPFSLVLFKRNDDFQCALMDNTLARSLIMKLYFFEGRGFKYIRPFIHNADLTRRTEIYVFRIDWDKFIQDEQKQE